MQKSAVQSGDSYEYSLDNILIASTTVADDYQDWATLKSLVGGPGDDDDGDGVSNLDEYVFGLDPHSGSSSNPITVPFDHAFGTLSFQRRDSALSGRTYTIWTSTNLDFWSKDTGAMLDAATPDANHVQQVEVTLSPALLTEPKLFVQVRAQ